jgi:hypothetical protein
MKSIIALSVLYVTQAFAKIGYGACPHLNFMTFAGYQAAYTNTGPSAVYNHMLVFGDKALQDLIGFARIFMPQIPSLQCIDAFPQPLYYADTSIWDPTYVQPADSLIFGLLGFNLATKSEAMYYCVDTKRAPAILKWFIELNLAVPPEVT